MKKLTKAVLAFIFLLNLVACTTSERFKLSLLVVEASADMNSSN